MILRFDRPTGRIKPMHAVNNAPMKPLSSPLSLRSNFDAYRAARFPYSRNHDASLCRGYGGEHTVDVQNIFRRFEADPYDPANYDFVHTDALIRRTLDAGTQTFYRLGTSIEGSLLCHYGTVPPPDFEKWSVICEHIIRHVNDGWADGHHFGIRYWEIWNEPDPAPGIERNPNTWDGTKEEFFRLYETASKHLKSRFPDLKIGGPAAAGFPDWIEDFLTFCEKHDCPLDFFSWHLYSARPEAYPEKAETIRRMLDSHGFGSAESILNEWNLEPRAEPGPDRFARFRTAFGAAYTASVMILCQSAPADMLMYYDARPGVYNGLFDFYTCVPLPPYYSFSYFADLYELGTAIELSGVPEGVFALAAVKDGDGALLLANPGQTEREFPMESGAFLPLGGKETSGDGCDLPLDISEKGTVILKPESVQLLLFRKETN